MNDLEAIVAVYPNHDEAEEAIRKLAIGGWAIKNLSVVGKGYHTEDKVVGFYNVGDRIKFWGSRGAFWGGLWGLFSGGLLLTVPAIGPVIVIGYLAATALATIESAVLVGGISAICAALYSIGIPKDSVLDYEAAIKADSFLVLAHGTKEEIANAHEILTATKPVRLDVHAEVKALNPETPTFITSV